MASVDMVKSSDDYIRTEKRDSSAAEAQASAYNSLQIANKWRMAMRGDEGQVEEEIVVVSLEQLLLELPVHWSLPIAKLAMAA